MQNKVQAAHNGDAAGTVTEGMSLEHADRRLSISAMVLFMAYLINSDDAGHRFDRLHDQAPRSARAGLPVS